VLCVCICWVCAWYSRPALYMVREISGGDLGSYFYKPPDLLSYVYVHRSLQSIHLWFHAILIAFRKLCAQYRNGLDQRNLKTQEHVSKAQTRFSHSGGDAPNESRKRTKTGRNGGARRQLRRVIALIKTRSFLPPPSKTPPRITRGRRFSTEINRRATYPNGQQGAVQWRRVCPGRKRNQ